MLAWSRPLPHPQVNCCAETGNPFSLFSQRLGTTGSKGAELTGL